MLQEGLRSCLHTAETYARLMKMDLDRVEIMLQKLKELGLAEKETVDSKTQWRSLNPRFVVKDNQGDLNLAEFHKASLLDAINALSEPKHLRKYKSLLLAMSEEDLKDFYTHLDTFSSEQFTRYTSDFYKNRRVYQINFNVHPVTQENN